jgi:uncharacterized protein with HEPN domain
MTEREKKYLSDIANAITLINEFTYNLSFEEYNSDIKTQSAVERQLGIIGEAGNKFDTLFPDENLNNIRQIVGFRNRLIHAYDSIDNSIVWAIIKKHLPELQQEIEDKLQL